MGWLAAVMMLLITEPKSNPLKPEKVVGELELVVDPVFAEMDASEAMI
jgi:hypothetical protein